MNFPMTVQPLAPWVRWTRIAVIAIGIGWLPCVYFWYRFIAPDESIRLIMIASIFLWATFFLWMLVLSVLLPTHKARLIGMPLVFVVLHLTAQSPPSLSNETAISLLWGALWLTTCVAITLLMPQFTTLAAFMIHVMKRVKARWMLQK
jgi:hypothetical protein